MPVICTSLCKLESAPDIALGRAKDFVAEFRAADDITGNVALKEVEVPVNCRSRLLHALRSYLHK